MPTTHPYDLVIGLDRSDKKADLCLIRTRTGQRRSVSGLVLMTETTVFRLVSSVLFPTL